MDVDNDKEEERELYGVSGGWLCNAPSNCRGEAQRVRPRHMLDILRQFARVCTTQFCFRCKCYFLFNCCRARHGRCRALARRGYTSGNHACKLCQKAALLASSFPLAASSLLDDFVQKAMGDAREVPPHFYTDPRII